MSAKSENATDQWAQNRQHYRRILHELIDIETDMARLVHRQALSQALASKAAGGDLGPVQKRNRSPAKAQDPSIALDRIALSIRCTNNLLRKLSEPVAAPAPPRFQHGGPRHDKSPRLRLIRGVDDALQGNGKE